MLDRDGCERLAHMLLNLGQSIEGIVANNAIPEAFKQGIRALLESQQQLIIEPAQVVAKKRANPEWLPSLDRSNWYYWPTLKKFLSDKKQWTRSAIQSLEDSSDYVVGLLASPSTLSFEGRGLVLGYVQSGKTANYTAVIAKAVDSGYRLVIVLAGTDNGLRYQTNVRLVTELVGQEGGGDEAVPLPPVGRQWHEFTAATHDGDFQSGYANHASLQGSQPVLLVIKKNRTVLERLLNWLNGLPAGIRQTIPVLVIDDEADQAGIDTKGSYQREGEPISDDYEQPTIINRLIRELLRQFDRCSYVAYTATPFANILVPHDAIDPSVGKDLYPQDFIVDLPRPHGYFGAEQLFGRMDSPSEGGIDVIRIFDPAELAALPEKLPSSLEDGILDFILAAAGRAQRGAAAKPATMLIHTSHLRTEQAQLHKLVDDVVCDLRNEWRYQRQVRLAGVLKRRWDEQFRPLTRSTHAELDVPFDRIEELIGPFMQAVKVMKINSDPGDDGKVEVLDYKKNPSLKAIAIGGNRLSRGLTLEGLLISYFSRDTPNYDTLLQMGRWFGFRSGYEDLMRIYTTQTLHEWFSDLALVEYQLREDIKSYKDLNVTPMEIGLRIMSHSSMTVTSPSKQRFSRRSAGRIDYSLELQQTVKFPLSRPADLVRHAKENFLLVNELVKRLGTHDPKLSDASGPAWSGITSTIARDFLKDYQQDPNCRSIEMDDVLEYITRRVQAGELVRWVIAVRGLAGPRNKLGQVNWGLPTGVLNQVSRTRLKGANSLGVIVDPDDENIGLSQATRGGASRQIRSPEEGLIILYPISKWSGNDGKSPKGNRAPLFDDPNDSCAIDLVGLGISFPKSAYRDTMSNFVYGTVDWRTNDGRI